ncbi:hypothetical protein R69658_08266 [Paraburkholderia aspalathi]|uniref:Uncharacterized protein n=1 Tax=Paraburkholderia aspalathi TaxID=1324617 RepID=A0ABM8TA01_9BURK|nr:hypothetical protein R69658_08266 [Paraburkholderia aspalathi]
MTVKPRDSSNSNTGIQYTPVDSIATVSIPQALSQSAMALRSVVKLANSRTGSSSRSGGTATKWDALPMSMPAALGWVIVSAARDLPGLRLTPGLRWAKACSIFSSGNGAASGTSLAHSLKRNTVHLRTTLGAIR